MEIIMSQEQNREGIGTEVARVQHPDFYFDKQRTRRTVIGVVFAALALAVILAWFIFYLSSDRTEMLNASQGNVTVTAQHKRFSARTLLTLEQIGEGEDWETAKAALSEGKDLLPLYRLRFRIDGREIFHFGGMTVSISLPSYIWGERAAVYELDRGGLKRLESEFSDGRISFTANRLGTYLVAADASHDTAFSAKMKFLSNGDGTCSLIGIGDCRDGAVVIPFEYRGERVTAIGDEAFLACDYLTSVVIPDSVTSIGKSAFAGCRHLTSAVIPESVTSIGEGAFKRCLNLDGIVIPDGVTVINKEVFSACVNLNQIEIPRTVTRIERSAFYSCDDLTEIVIPERVTSIGAEAFSFCERLERIVIPESVKEIGHDAFYGCRSLLTVALPSGITHISESLFDGCYNLEGVVIPDGVTEIGRSAFSDCVALKELTIPESVTFIDDSAFFHCESLRAAVIPDGVTAIGDGTFFACYELKSIVIPSSVTSIGELAFYDCVALKEIRYGGTKDQWKNNILFSDDWDESFWDCTVYCTDGAIRIE